jgi:hypothetical protein
MSIDRIAREMVDMEPSAHLEARIRARLDAEPPARAVRSWSWKVVVPVAAAAALVVVAINIGPGATVQSPGSRVQGPGSRVQGPGSTVQGPGSTVQGPVPQVPGPSLQPVADAPVRRAASASRGTSRVAKVEATLSAEELAWMERRVPALDPVVALDVEHLRVASIQPEPLAITPLTMTPVGTEGAGSERRNDR